MKFDKETGIVILIAVILLAGWWFYFGAPSKKQAQQQLIQTVPAAPAAPATPAPVVSAAPAVQTVPAVKTAEKVKLPLFRKKLPVLEPVVLKNKLTTVTVDPVKGTVRDVLFTQYKTSNKKDLLTFHPEDSNKETFALDMGQGWEIVSCSKPVVKTDSFSVEKVYSDGKNSITVVQTFTLPENSYSLKAGFTLSNTGKTVVTIPVLTFWNAGLPPLKYMAGDTVYNDPHNVEYCAANAGKLTSVSPSAKQEKFDAAAVSAPVAWIGTSNKYFASLLFPEKAFDGGMTLSRIAKPMPEKPSENYYVPSIGGLYRNVTLAPNGTAVYSFSCYTGPKSVEEISKLPETAIGVLHLSYFSVMEFLSRPLVILLKWLKNFCGSYGIAIILLTIIVRVVFWPVTQKANNSMRKMQKVGPLVKEIREKFKDNPQLMNQKMMELYRKEGVNPLGGCLPILLQIPVFLALYSALDAAVELRHVSFLWATDLTKPDLVGPQFLFGYGIHPLILIMTGLMVLQQKMTPAANGDPMQQKMMMFMPVIMLVMLYNLPSGLTLYWTVSQIFSILQMKYTQIIAKREEEKEARNSVSKPA